MYPDKTLKHITGDLRLLAGVLIVLGSLCSLALTSRALEAQIIGALGCLILLAPGVWFALASIYIRRGSLPVVRWSLWIASAQVTLVVLSLAAMLLFYGTRGFTRANSPFCLPAGLFLFFLPAEAVLVWQLFRAREIIRANEDARGFDVHVGEGVQVAQPVLHVAQPLEPEQPDKRP